MKICSRCKKEKLFSDYCKSSRMKDGYQSACKACMADSWKRSRNNKLEHYKEVQRKREENNACKAREWKSQKGCSVCDEKEPECLELHHIDPSVKEHNPSDLSRISLNAFLKEAEKCVVLCANCHRKVHSGKLKLGFA